MNPVTMYYLLSKKDQKAVRQSFDGITVSDGTLRFLTWWVSYSGTYFFGLYWVCFLRYGV